MDDGVGKDLLDTQLVWLINMICNRACMIALDFGDGLGSSLGHGLLGLKNENGSSVGLHGTLSVLIKRSHRGIGVLVFLLVEGTY